MESLCRQIPPVDGWELIIFEEKHITQVGEQYIMGYYDRLKEAGCERVEYITADDRYPLSMKWVIIAQHASPESEYFCLCAADNYYSRWMVSDAEGIMINKLRPDRSCDWAVYTKGYFYDFNHKKVIHYNYTTIVGLQMFARTSRVRGFPMESKRKGVDTWMSHNIFHKDGKRIATNFYIDGGEHWRQILCTNGLNNISKERHKYFENPQPPFYETDVDLEDIVPWDIAGKIRNLI
jgi:hypothetical protein